MHRTTFYGHHRDVVGFAASVFMDELDAIARVEIDAHTSLAPLAISDACTESLTRMLEHIAHERRSAGAHDLPRPLRLPRRLGLPRRQPRSGSGGRTPGSRRATAPLELLLERVEDCTDLGLGERRPRRAVGIR
ncbi:hypothetical protein GCM10027057_26360 [Marisediminicola antarctica]|uniref:Uncharacterized protein n=1 Tax=Marisediminicola antarctica TaxID=674079 RepID=A0A7L5AMN2_9MICO|nr:hypothetical protein BHD05_12775 [Marisediminicola antarctica]